MATLAQRLRPMAHSLLLGVPGSFSSQKFPLARNCFSVSAQRTSMFRRRGLCTASSRATQETSNMDAAAHPSTTHTPDASHQAAAQLEPEANKHEQSASSGDPLTDFKAHVASRHLEKLFMAGDFERAWRHFENLIERKTATRNHANLALRFCDPLAVPGILEYLNKNAISPDTSTLTTLSHRWAETGDPSLLFDTHVSLYTRYGVEPTQESLTLLQKSEPQGVLSLFKESSGGGLVFSSYVWAAAVNTLASTGYVLDVATLLEVEPTPSTEVFTTALATYARHFGSRQDKNLPSQHLARIASIDQEENLAIEKTPTPHPLASDTAADDLVGGIKGVQRVISLAKAAGVMLESSAFEYALSVIGRGGCVDAVSEILSLMKTGGVLFDESHALALSNATWLFIKQAKTTADISQSLVSPLASTILESGLSFSPQAHVILMHAFHRYHHPKTTGELWENLKKANDPHAIDTSVWLGAAVALARTPTPQKAEEAVEFILAQGAEIPEKLLRQLVLRYCAVGDLPNLAKSRERLSQRGVPMDVKTANFLVAAYGRGGLHAELGEVIRSVHDSGLVLEDKMVTVALNSLAKVGDRRGFDLAVSIVRRCVEGGSKPDFHVFRSVTYGYASFSDVIAALGTLEWMRQLGYRVAPEVEGRIRYICENQSSGGALRGVSGNVSGMNAEIPNTGREPRVGEAHGQPSSENGYRNANEPPENTENGNSRVTMTEKDENTASNLLSGKQPYRLARFLERMIQQGKTPNSKYYEGLFELYSQGKRTFEIQNTVLKLRENGIRPTAGVLEAALWGFAVHFPKSELPPFVGQVEEWMARHQVHHSLSSCIGALRLHINSNEPVSESVTQTLSLLDPTEILDDRLVHSLARAYSLAADVGKLEMVLRICRERGIQPSNRIYRWAVKACGKAQDMDGLVEFLSEFFDSRSKSSPSGNSVGGGSQSRTEAVPAKEISKSSGGADETPRKSSAAPVDISAELVVWEAVRALKVARDEKGAQMVLHAARKGGLIHGSA